MNSDPQRNRQSGDEDGGNPRLGLYLWIGLIVLCAFGLWQLDRLFPTERDDYSNAILIRNIAILALVSSSVLFIKRLNVRETVRNAATWIVILAVFALGYVYQDEMRSVGTRLMSEIVPGYAVSTGTGEMVLTESNGHFLVIADINGVAVTFLVDTGASDIVLSPRDARRIGMDMQALDYTRRASTANGMVRGAPTVIPSLVINGIEFASLPVTVNEAEMDTSLLGMAFLRRLRSYEVRDRQLYLRW